ncbi:hypothetical protein B0J18DRAFT_157511 [Chaetomium sp. MPI-SDFR-AT-0129]|nr:hypothetical protein B0J18DRAFT_157511 [Chaetomium sp. MPI-SDFR-AT-0129]
MSLASETPSLGNTTSIAAPVDAKGKEKLQEPPLAAKPRAGEGEEKKKRRSLFGLGRKKADDSSANKSNSAVKPTTTTTATSTLTTGRAKPSSPIQTDHARIPPSSPGGRSAFASSPRLASPAGSQIFERDVQESTAALLPSSPNIPSHIQTENYIPPVLDASSEAITDGHLSPDTVEIITHTSHQPAGASLAVGGYGHGSSLALSPQSAVATEPPSWTDELDAFSTGNNTNTNNNTATTTTTTSASPDTASNYGSFDTTDVRRLSFISFADVVQAEQHHGSPPFPGSSVTGSPPRDRDRDRDSVRLTGLTSLSSLGGSGGNELGVGGYSGNVSPPLSKDGSVKGLDVHGLGVGAGGATATAPTASTTGIGASHVRASSPASGHSLSHGAGGRSLASPASLVSMQLPGGGSAGTGGGEIAIETMSQALRKTGSGDLSVGGLSGSGGVRSFPTSPI